MKQEKMLLMTLDLENNMEKEIQEFNQAVTECRAKLSQAVDSSYEAREKMSKLMSSSHLKGILGWIRQDLELQSMLREIK